MHCLTVNAVYAKLLNQTQGCLGKSVTGVLVTSYFCKRLASFATSANRENDSEAIISLFDGCKRIQAACCFRYTLSTWHLDLSVCPFVTKLDTLAEYSVTRGPRNYIDGPIWFHPALVSSVIANEGSWFYQAKA